MTELLTAAQMRAIERAAINGGHATGLELMERAGRGVIDAMLAWRPDLAAGAARAVVLCGPGNNGGDGFVIARLLAERGWAVEVFFKGDPARQPPDAAENHRRWRAMGAVHPFRLEALRQRVADAPGALVCIDAVFGTGLSRPLERDDLALFEGLAADPRMAHVAVDVPSGLCADSGRGLWSKEPMQPAARLTVAFHRAKCGHILGDGPRLCGALAVAEIGLEGTGTDGVPCLDASAGAAMARVLRMPQGHKYDRGHALVLSGPPGKGGAARLAARGALRIGAGLVSVACPPGALQEHAARLDAVMLQPIRGAAELSDLLTDGRISALCLGPGMGLTARTREMVETALAAGRPTVLDADALTVFADAPGALFDRLHPRSVLTPHAGEFARLFPDIAARLAAPATKGPAYSKLDATREAAARAGCVVLLKGPDTVVADAAGQAAINAAVYDRAAPWLATAGAGDVLAGCVTGLMARGIDPHQATVTAAWLHVACALQVGPGLIAEDLPEQLPAVFRSLGL